MTNEEDKVLGFTFSEAIEKFGREEAKDMFYISHYGTRKSHTLYATREEAERFRGLEPTITVIDEEYDETI